MRRARELLRTTTLRSAEVAEQVVFVPVYPELPERAFRRLLHTLSRLQDERLGEFRPVREPGEPVRS